MKIKEDHISELKILYDMLNFKNYKLSNLVLIKIYNILIKYYKVGDTNNEESIETLEDKIKVTLQLALFYYESSLKVNPPYMISEEGDSRKFLKLAEDNFRLCLNMIGKTNKNYGVLNSLI